jgi:electron transfer flavoprotein alpha subunit
MFRLSSCLRGKSLVIVEAAAGVIAPVSLAAVTAAGKCGPVTALVAGTDAAALGAAAAQIAGVAAVIAVAGAHYDNGLAEELAPLVAATVKAGEFTHVVAGSSAFGKTLVPRAAALLGAMPIADVSAIVSEDTFVRMTYAGNAVNTVKSSDAVKLMTIRGTNFDRAAATGGSAAVAEGAATPAAGKSAWVEDKIEKSEKVDLTTAANVVSGGRGFKNKENRKLVEDLAAPLKAGVGATRAVCDAGDAPFDQQIGQTGKIVAPNLYMALGLSGAIQHAAGMKDAKTIVAINTDEDAPIFQIADYGLVEDVFTAVPKLTELVKQ